MFRFLGHPPDAMVCVAPEAGVQESSKSDPRCGGDGLWGFDLWAAPSGTVAARLEAVGAALSDGLVGLAAGETAWEALASVLRAGAEALG